MVLSVLPAAAGGGIKSVQRGSAGSSGNVTITAVDIAKSFVTVFGTASSGTAIISGNVNVNSSNLIPKSGNQVNTVASGTGDASFSATMSGGTTNLVAAVVQGFLANSTTLTVSAACRWEVVEFL
jgi:hypothetical protein